MIGQTISHYKILEKLGEGGMGVVYKAQDLELDRIVALKFLSPLLTADEAEKKRFEHEARAVSALDHPNICTFYELGKTERGQLFIAMAYYEGQTVKDRVKDRPLPLSEALDIALGIAHGLSKAHEKGVTHRDIKSENIIVTTESGVKIMDFGIAKISGASALTKTGATLGTVPYMSPEQARGEKADHRSDIWSFGAVLYEMVTGLMPFKSEHHEAMVYLILNENPQPVTALRTGVPMELERIISKCLEKKASDRYQHMDEVIVDLRKVKVGSRTDGQKISAPQRFHWNRWYLVGGAAVLIAVLLLLFFPKSNTSENTIHSIAVLPLENLSGDPEQEYFADGMTEALITNLAKISALRVISRTSVMHFKATKKTIPEIAKELNVDAIVEGSVQRSGDRVRITAQLLHAPMDRHLWADSYERDMTDVFALQTDVALAIVKEIHAKLTPQEETHLASAPAVNKEAYELYLKGRFYWNKRTKDGLNKAIEHFDQAIEKDPTYALAYAGLASSYALLPEYAGQHPEEVIPKAKAAATKALQFDGSLGEAFALLGLVKQQFEWDWEGAENEYKRSIELNPNYPTTHQWYSTCLRVQGRLEESLAEIKRAQELDPLSPIIDVNVAEVLYWMKLYDRAIEQLRKTLELSPDFPWAHRELGSIYEKQGKFEEAIAEFQKTRTLVGDSPFGLESLGHAYASAGRKSEAVKALNELVSMSKQGHWLSCQIAFVYAGLADKERALEWLQKAYDERNSELIYLKMEPLWVNLRSDLRFNEILKKINLFPISSSDLTKSKPSQRSAVTESTWQNSIAVLPFKNISSDKEQEYFCDGMTEAIITDLAKIAELIVMSPAAVSRYRGKNVDLTEISKALQVRYVVEGSVQRRGTSLRVSARLTNVETGAQLWADRFDRTIRDIFAVQDDISRKIVAGLQLKVGSATELYSPTRPTQNLEAYDLYLRGRYYLNKQSVKDINQAIELLEQTVRIDPNSAIVLASLGMAYAQKSFYDEPLKKEWEEKAFVTIEKALAIDPNLAEAYVAKGNLLWTPANHFPHEKAIAAYRRAVELKPNLEEAHEWLGLVLYHLGLFDAGLEECRKALQINPSSAFAQSRVGINLLYAGRYQEALTELLKVPEGFSVQIVPTQIAITLSYLGKREEAKQKLQEVSRELPDDPFVLSAQALLFAQEGKTREALQKIQLAEKREKTYLGHFHHAAYNIGSAYALMKNNAKAVVWLQKTADDGFPCYPKYENDPNLDKIRQDPQFISLMKDLKKRWESFKAMI